MPEGRCDYCGHLFTAREPRTYVLGKAYHSCNAVNKESGNSCSVQHFIDRNVKRVDDMDR